MKAAEHRAEAERLIEYAEAFGIGDPRRDNALRFAAVHATLATIADPVELTLQGTDLKPTHRKRAAKKATTKEPA